jgi:predicted DNA-binding protein (UPF0251 family)
MGRRTRMRFVKIPPENFYFYSRNDEPIADNFIELTVAEFEAMRLKHYLEMRQKMCAEKMGLSQPTFSRILKNAHKKITQAIIEGKKIRIQGGNVDFKETFNGYGCLNCFEEWADDLATAERKLACPKCQSTKTYHLIREPL